MHKIHLHIILYLIFGILTTFVKNDSSDGSEKKVKKKSKEVTLYLDNQNTLYETIKSFIKRKITKE
mgnify:CR=1 FL=1